MSQDLSEYDILITQKLIKEMSMIKEQILGKKVVGYCLIAIIDSPESPVPQAISSFDGTVPLMLIGALDVTLSEVRDAFKGSPLYEPQSNTKIMIEDGNNTPH